MATARKITAKQEAFCLAFMKELNATEAFRQVYGPRKSAECIRKNASRLMDHPVIKARVAELRAQHEKQINVDTVRVLFENARIGLSDARKLFDPDTGELKSILDLDDDTAAAISSVKVRKLFGEGKDDKGEIGTVTEVKLWDKGAALERFFKHFGLYEKDNRQKVDPFADLPREQTKALLDYIRARLLPRTPA